MPKNQRNQEAMGTESIRTLLPRMAVPTIVAQLITTFYNLVDTFFVSQLGTSATAAVGVNNSLERIITLFATLIGAGACSYIARLLGSKRRENADEVMSTSITIGLGIGVLMAVVGKLCLSPLVDFLGATPDCRQYSMEYGTYVLYAAPFMIGSLILNMVLRSEGSATFSMIGIGFGGILNCFLDPIFIFTLDLGVAGASLATCISKFISFAILLWPYLRKKTAVRLSLRCFRFRMADAKEVVGIGMTSFMRAVLNVVAMVCLNRVAGRYSTSVLAAISVTGRIMMFPFSAILGFGQGYQPVVGFNWGAKNYHRVEESLDFAMRVSIFGGLILGALFCIFARPLVGLFNSAGDAEIFRYGCLAIRAEAVFLCLHGTGVIVNMFFAGIGMPRYAMVLSTARQGYCFIPLIYLLPLIFDVTGLCIAQGCADMLAGCISFVLYRKAKKLLNEKLAAAQIVG